MARCISAPCTSSPTATAAAITCGATDLTPAGTAQTCFTPHNDADQFNLGGELWRPHVEAVGGYLPPGHRHAGGNARLTASQLDRRASSPATPAPRSNSPATNAQHAGRHHVRQRSASRSLPNTPGTSSSSSPASRTRRAAESAEQCSASARRTTRAAMSQLRSTTTSMRSQASCRPSGLACDTPMTQDRHHRGLLPREPEPVMARPRQDATCGAVDRKNAERARNAAGRARRRVAPIVDYHFTKRFDVYGGMEVSATSRRHGGRHVSTGGKLTALGYNYLHQLFARPSAPRYTF